VFILQRYAETMQL